MSKVMYRSDDSYVSCRAGIYYYIRRVPYDVRQHYASNRLSFSLKTKSYAGALRAAQSVTQRLEDYWLGLRLQDMDIHETKNYPSYTQFFQWRHYPEVFLFFIPGFTPQFSTTPTGFVGRS